MKNFGTKVEMLISSVVSLIASFVLSVEALKLAANPAAELACDISAKISCGTVGLSWQANLLGFPNSFLGLISEPVVITIAVALLAGVTFPRWFMITAQFFYSIGFIFAYWLFYQAYFNIGALCPWCLAITIATTLVFFSIIRVNFTEGNFGEKAKNVTAKFFSLHADTAIAILIVGIILAMLMRYL